MAPRYSKHTSKEVSASHTSQTRYIVPIIGLNRPEKQTLNKRRVCGTQMSYRPYG